MKELAAKHILLTGGTGMLGRHILHSLLLAPEKPASVLVFSRDEQKQYDLRKAFSRQQYPELRFALGDIRDYRRVLEACRGIDFIIHAAALKHVPLGEEHGYEFIKTNAMGTQNIIEAARERNVKQVLSISTDKAVDPYGLYGASKLCADRLIINAGRKDTHCRFSVLRLGNIFGARGSVVPYFAEAAQTGKLMLTHPDATRFSILPGECIKLLFRAVRESRGGEVFIPKMRAYRLSDLAEAIAPHAVVEVTGLRKGEKMHEHLVSETELHYLREEEEYFVLRPEQTSDDIQLPPLKSLRSDDKDKLLNIRELREILKATYDSPPG
jgi:FlaA1/EpsC-like NDP-sugar epimerase